MSIMILKFFFVKKKKKDSIPQQMHAKGQAKTQRVLAGLHCVALGQLIIHKRRNLGMCM